VDRRLIDAHLAQLQAKHPNLDGLCKRCGWCCHWKVKQDGKVFFSTKICPYLVDQKCSIYPFRFDLFKPCLHLADSIERGCMPRDCPYVVGLEGYQGPETDRVVVG
jgi:uncharacterized cysteine cluster protein YcgN (CxxCxxCC family)